MDLKKLQEMFKEMWDLQGALNILVGRDTIGAGKNKTLPREFIHQMTEDYMDEVINEACECKEDFFHKWWVKEVIENPSKRFTPIDLAKVKVELIDILHFLMSACQVNNIEFFCEENLSSYLKAWELCDGQMDHRTAYHCLNSVIRGAIEGDIHLIFRSLFCIFRFYNISFGDIYEVYKMKCKKNINRYQTGYSVKTKTEQDNHEIEEKIRNAQT